MHLTVSLNSHWLDPLTTQHGIQETSDQLVFVFKNANPSFHVQLPVDSRKARIFRLSPIFQANARMRVTKIDIQS